MELEKLPRSTLGYETGKMIDSGYDLSDYEQANMGVADFDGDLDADVVITGKNSNWNNGSWMDQYISDILINVRGFAGPDDSSGGIANDGSGDALESGPLKKSVGSKKVYGLNARPLPPTNVEFQRSRLQAFNPVDDNGDEINSSELNPLRIQIMRKDCLKWLSVGEEL